MKTAVDASVLWSLVNREPDALCRAARDGVFLICPVAFAEIAPACASNWELLDELDRLSIKYDPILPPAAWKEGQIFKIYRRAGGPRRAMIPDFLIAAHAELQADCVAAGERGCLRIYFPRLRILSAQAA